MDGGIRARAVSRACGISTKATEKGPFPAHVESVPELPKRDPFPRMWNQYRDKKARKTILKKKTASVRFIFFFPDFARVSFL